jgi:hypothetical protein
MVDLQNGTAKKKPIYQVGSKSEGIGSNFVAKIDEVIFWLYDN